MKPNPRMDIGFVHPTWPGGEGTGAAHSATQIVTGLRDRGHTITAYCREKPDGEAVKGISCVPLELDRFPYHGATVLNSALRCRVDELGGHDVVHSYLPSAIPALSRIGAETDAATVVTLNAYAGVCPKNDLLYRGREHCIDNSPTKCVECIARTGGGHGLRHRAKRAAGRLGNLRIVRKGIARVEHVDGFRAPSGHVRDSYAELGFPRERIHVIPHPLDEQFLVDHTSDFREPIELLFVGYLEPQKGVDKLAPIIAGLRQRGIAAELTVVGDGQERAAMGDQAQGLGVEQWIDFRGLVPNAALPTVYAAHDLLVHPGVWLEPLARVYIEALAAGTPIVTTEYGDVRTVIGGGGVTTDGTVEGFVDVLVELIQEGQLPALSHGAGDTVDRYRKENVVPRVEALYDSIT